MARGIARVDSWTRALHFEHDVATPTGFKSLALSDFCDTAQKFRVKI